MSMFKTTERISFSIEISSIGWVSQPKKELISIEKNQTFQMAYLYGFGYRLITPKSYYISKEQFETLLYSNKIIAVGPEDKVVLSCLCDLD